MIPCSQQEKWHVRCQNQKERDSFPVRGLDHYGVCRMVRDFGLGTDCPVAGSAVITPHPSRRGDGIVRSTDGEPGVNVWCRSVVTGPIRRDGRVKIKNRAHPAMNRVIDGGAKSRTRHYLRCCGSRTGRGDPISEAEHVVASKPP